MTKGKDWRGGKSNKEEGAAKKERRQERSDVEEGLTMRKGRRRGRSVSDVKKNEKR